MRNLIAGAISAVFAILTPTATALAQTDGTAPASVDTIPMIMAVEEDEPVEAVEVVESDSLFFASEEAPLELEMITVSARRIIREAGADRIELDDELIETQDGGSVADLVTLLPSTKLTVNSRGESLFMVRGSSERHLRVELDGIPLTVPWDERVDLSMLPLLAVDRVEARRGVGSVLEEPNTLAGTIEMHTREQVLPGSATRVAASGGEVGAWALQGMHQRRHGDWGFLVAAEHRRQEGFLVPATAEPGLHQDPALRTRLNSQVKQSSALAKVERGFGDQGRWHLMMQASDGEKGVPPEEHLADPRFWQYPKVQRLLFGGRLQTPEAARWRLDTSASVDFFNQDIDSYPDASYETRDAWENDRDRTGFWRARLARSVGGSTEVRARTTVRYAEHRETLSSNPTELLFSQLLLGAAAEVEHEFGDALVTRGGAGYEGATTPESGDKPRSDANHELALHAAVEGHFSEDGRWHVNGSRRPRMPSLRELYSGALGTFEPNEELRPELQNALEAGMSWQASRWNVSLNGFAQQIDGAIERITLPDGNRQRVNLDEVRNLGVEVGSVIKPIRGIAFDLQGTWLYSRAKGSSGDFDRRVEDRPEWLATLAGTWTHRSGLRLRAELDGVGERYSLDQRKTDPDDPYTRLDPSARFNLRVSWRHFGEVGGYAGSEWFVRLDNVLDAETFSQVGLIESGRTVLAGLRVDFDR
jgi:iron complex outermembrane receptor protein